MVEEFLGQADVAAGHVDVRAPQRGRHGPSHPAVHAVVLQRDDQFVLRRQLDHAVGHRQHPTWIDHRHADALIVQPLGHPQRHPRERADPDQQHVVTRPAGRDRENIHA